MTINQPQMPLRFVGEMLTGRFVVVVVTVRPVDAPPSGMPERLPVSLETVNVRVAEREAARHTLHAAEAILREQHRRVIGAQFAHCRGERFCMWPSRMIREDIGPVCPEHVR